MTDFHRSTCYVHVDVFITEQCLDRLELFATWTALWLPASLNWYSTANKSSLGGLFIDTMQIMVLQSSKLSTRYHDADGIKGNIIFAWSEAV